MSSLDRKLLRDLWRLRMQALAIALVIASGVALLVMALTTTASLQATMDAYYERYRFANVFAAVRRVPDSLIHQIAAVAGVRVAETRIVETGMLDVPSYPEPIVGQFLSLPKHGVERLNALVLRSGRLPVASHPDEVVVSEPFAEAHHLHPGDTLGAILRGRKRTLLIVGTALSPEFVYQIPPGGLMPDDRRFGILWMGRDALAAAYGLKGAFNNVVLGLMHGAQSEAVVQRLDALLARYGGTGAYTRSEQVSNWFLTNEIAQQKSMSRILPVIFLAVAAFLTNMVMGRLIATERREIGLLKAFGYGDLLIGWHYAKLMLTFSAIGIVLGFLLGAALGDWNTRLYAEFFCFPFLLYRPDPGSFAIAGLVSVAASLAGGLAAVLRAVRLAPATAMQQASPPLYRRGWLARTSVALWLDEPSRMIARRLMRWPVRAFVTSAGLAMSVAVLVVALQWISAVDTLVQTYYVQGQHQDATISFADIQPEATIGEIGRMPGVIATEPFRIVPARFMSGRRSEREAVIGVPRGALLSPVHDIETGPVDVPQDGLLLSKTLADVLGVRTGDPVTVQLLEGRRRVVTMPVTRIFDTYIGKPAYINLAALNRLMRDGQVLTGLHVTIDAPAQAAFLARLKTMPNIAAIQLRRAAIGTFYATLGETIFIFTGFFVAFATVLSIGVIYNSLRIALSERERELATLRVLGFSRMEVAYILLGEIGVLTWFAIPLGCVFGAMLVWYIASAFDTELFRVPLAIGDSTYGTAALVTLATTVACAEAMRRRLGRLDLIAVLKTRE